MNILELLKANYIDLILSFVIAVVLLIFVLWLSKRKIFAMLFILFYFGFVVLSLLEFNIASSILLITIIALLSTYISVHANKIGFLVKSLSKRKAINTLDAQDKEEFYKIIEDAVLNLSLTKTGALMTFEKNEDLTEFIERGKSVDCKISSDLIRSIFFVGTPLHDGAIIIRGNMIQAASVYYTPTTKAMPGKFGARHRAALGFSENHNSVTIVVSEETGRIAFAYKGDLIPCSHGNFRSRFEELIND